MTNKDYIFYGDFDGIVGYLFTSDMFGPNVIINRINNHSIQIDTMNIFMKIGAGLLAGITVFAALGRKKKDNSVNQMNSGGNSSGDPNRTYEENNSEMIGNNQGNDNQSSQKSKGSEAIDGLRTIQNVFTQVCNFINSMVVIVDNISKLFTVDPRIHVSASTILT